MSKKNKQTPKISLGNTGGRAGAPAITEANANATTVASSQLDQATDFRCIFSSVGLSSRAAERSLSFSAVAAANAAAATGGAVLFFKERSRPAGAVAMLLLFVPCCSVTVR